jgi:hypothetical protein
MFATDKQEVSAVP